MKASCHSGHTWDQDGPETHYLIIAYSYNCEPNEPFISITRPILIVYIHCVNAVYIHANASLSRHAAHADRCVSLHYLPQRKGRSCGVLVSHDHPPALNVWVHTNVLPLYTWTRIKVVAYAGHMKVTCRPLESHMKVTWRSHAGHMTVLTAILHAAIRASKNCWFCTSEPCASGGYQYCPCMRLGS